MIIGIGSDLIDIRRIQDTFDRYGERFVRRIFTDVERAKAEKRKEKVATYAKRFAAKEAFGKALGTGVAAPATLHAVIIDHDSRGKPVFRFAPGLAAHMEQERLHAHLTLTDETDYVVAFVVLERQ